MLLLFVLFSILEDVSALNDLVKLNSVDLWWYIFSN